MELEYPTRSYDPGPSHCQAEAGGSGAGSPDSDSARLVGTGKGPLARTGTGGVGPRWRTQRLGPAPSGVADPCGRVDLGTEKDPPVDSTLSQVRKSELLDWYYPEFDKSSRYLNQIKQRRLRPGSVGPGGPLCTRGGPVPSLTPGGPGQAAAARRGAPNMMAPFDCQCRGAIGRACQ